MAHDGAVEAGGEPVMLLLGHEMLQRRRAAAAGPLLPLAASLHAVTGEERFATLARAILDGYAERYLSYPNRDNVLGPSRPFFSTYLESIWLLYICVAMDLLESSGSGDALAARVRERVIEPSASLVASYDEGGSNRQVWNNAALLAARLLLDRPEEAQRTVTGRWGVLAHLSTGLLADGSWFEGENYHLFAHRGLWYGVTLARRAGVQIPGTLVRRFDEGYATPLATALPDFTFPSRRDSQYAISLRQWRFAESCEIGLVRTGDRRLLGALHELYERPFPRGDTGRWRSTAESERNEPASGLSRADLGWRSLLFARPTLPPLEPVAARSALLEWQGYGVLRRDAGQVYVALDYGHSGGGHGHPDRLNVLLCVGGERWLDDMGTGSYVDPTLHWYRSTLAHNAPLVDGHSQYRASGILRAYDERGGAGWIEAEARPGGIAPGVRVSRAVVVMTDYAIDQLTWEGERELRLELPLHVVGTFQPPLEWRPSTLDGGAAPTDGFSYVRDAATACLPEAGARLRLDSRAAGDAWIFAAPATALWRGMAPGAPGTGDRPFLLLRSERRKGTITTVWSWGEMVTDVEPDGDRIRVRRRSGEVHTHGRRGQEWHIDLAVGDAHSSITLGGMQLLPAAEVARPSLAAAEAPMRAPAIPVGVVRALTFRLGADHYRRSEESWREAGAPEAVVSLGVQDMHFLIDVDVRKRDVTFRPADAPDPELDNEHPDIHSDGVQLHLWCPPWDAPAGWLAVPERASGRVRVREIDGSRSGVPLAAAWRETKSGYAMTLRIPLAALGRLPAIPIALDVLVNDMAPGRERRRGQLVLSGARDDFVYLRGDRQSPDRYLPFVITGA